MVYTCKLYREMVMHVHVYVGLGIVEESVHGILADIDNDGFIWGAIEEACAIEDDVSRPNTTFTCNLTNDEPSLATFNRLELQVFAVACTHTNQGLAAAWDVETHYEEIAS